MCGPLGPLLGPAPRGASGPASLQTPTPAVPAPPRSSSRLGSFILLVKLKLGRGLVRTALWSGALGAGLWRGLLAETLAGLSAGWPHGCCTGFGPPHRMAASARPGHLPGTVHSPCRYPGSSSGPTCLTLHLTQLVLNLGGEEVAFALSPPDPTSP